MAQAHQGGAEMNFGAKVGDDERLRRFTSPHWDATLRHGLLPAPRGLALVQDFLNTRGSSGRKDLLSTASAATRWADSAVRAWSECVKVNASALQLSEDDLPAARALRAQLHDATALGWFDSAQTFTATAQFRLGSDGTTWIPNDVGWQGLHALVLGEVFLAHHDGKWRRFKVCADKDCGVAFYDRSWDNRATFHSGRVCRSDARMAAPAITQC